MNNQILSDKDYYKSEAMDALSKSVNVSGVEEAQWAATQANAFATLYLAQVVEEQTKAIITVLADIHAALGGQS